MRVIPPLTITAAMLTSSTAPEPGSGEAEWSSGTTYGLGDTVILAATHRKYESVAVSNLNNPPASDDGTKWIDAGPTNRWACLDLLRDTATVFPASPGTVVITPGQRIDSLALVGLVADSVTVTVTVSAVVKYTHTEDLSTREVLNWYDHFYAPFSSKAAVALFDLPPYTNGVITVTVTRATGSPKLGGIVMGLSAYLGRTLHDAESVALNFSSVDRDFAGNVATMIQRRTVPKTVQKVRCSKSQVNKIIAVRETLNAVPALWSGLDDSDSGYFEALLILGFYRTFTVNMDQPNDALVTLELEEI
ncbi:hypothetical protein [Synechococcus phage Ssp-JY42]|nr:hypothetical protein [Synechococcus phage Yong-M4-211]